MTLEDNLRQIEEALHVNGLWKSDEVTRNGWQALTSLHTLLDSDAGEDEKIIDLALSRAKGWTSYGELWPLCDNALAALSRLSAKAKLGEAEIREAKRGVLEKFRDKYFIPNWTQWPGFLELIDREFAALDKESGK